MPVHASRDQRQRCSRRTWCFEQEIPPGSRTGRLKFQGGQVIYVIAVAATRARRCEVSRGRRAPSQPAAAARRHRRAAFQHGLRKRRRASWPSNRICSRAPASIGLGFEQLEDAPEFRRQPAWTDAERTRTREREPGEERTYDKMLRTTARRVNATPWVRWSLQGRPGVEQSRQGRIRYYQPQFTRTRRCSSGWCSAELRTASGKHRHQGGLRHLRDRGPRVSMVDGERWEWGGWDRCCCRLRPEAGTSAFQSRSRQPVDWIAFINTPISEHLATK